MLPGRGQGTAPGSGCGTQLCTDSAVCCRAPTEDELGLCE